MFIYCEAETYKFWLEGGFHFSFFKLLPFDVPEERMVLDCILSSMSLDEECDNKNNVPDISAKLKQINRFMLHRKETNIS